MHDPTQVAWTKKKEREKHVPLDLIKQKNKKLLIQIILNHANARKNTSTWTWQTYHKLC